MEDKKVLINVDDARRGILAIEPMLACIVDQIKPVDAVEVVHGRWEFRRSEKYSWCTDAVCTACENILDTHIDNDLEYRQDAIKKKLLYCPKCGAKMDRERKDNADNEITR